MALNAVVLPAPFGPISDSTSPGPTSKLMPLDGGEAAEPDGEAVDDQLRPWRLRAHRAASVLAGAASASLPACWRPCHQLRNAGTMPSGRKYTTSTISTP